MKRKPLLNAFIYVFVCLAQAKLTQTLESASMNVDWDTGLPTDVLALVAKAGGIQQMKIMRSISKSWQQGFELAITSLAITKLEHTVLPPGVAAGHRFPCVACLKLGYSAVDTEWLENLGAFPNLDSVTLGGLSASLGPFLGFERGLALRLDDAAMRHLQV